MPGLGRAAARGWPGRGQGSSLQNGRRPALLSSSDPHPGCPCPNPNNPSHPPHPPTFQACLALELLPRKASLPSLKPPHFLPGVAGGSFLKHQGDHITCYSPPSSGNHWMVIHLINSKSFSDLEVKRRFRGAWSLYL